MDLSRRFDPNPIIVKEIRSRMRGSRAFATISITLILLGAVVYGLYHATLAGSQYTSSPISPQIGQMMFAGLAFFELLIITIVTPPITAGQISGEREHQTYEMLLATPLNPTSILWGKLVSAMSYVFLVIFAAVPMASMVFIYGGVTLRDMLKTLIALVVIALFFGVIGLFFSTLFNHTGRAVVTTYVCIALLLFAPLFTAVLAGIFHQSDPPHWIMNPSPIMALASAFQPSMNPDSITSTFWMLGSPVYWIMGNPPISDVSIPRPAYHIAIPVYGLIAIILYMISTRLVKPVRRFNIPWPEAAFGLVILLGYLGMVMLAFLATTNRYENIKIVSPATSTPIPSQNDPADLAPDQPSDSLTDPDVVYPPPRSSLVPGQNFPATRVGNYRVISGNRHNEGPQNV